MEIIGNINTLKRALSPQWLNMANNIAKFQQSYSLPIIKMLESANDMVKIVSPSIYKSTSQAKILSDALSPTLAATAMIAEKYYKCVGSVIQQMDQKKIAWENLDLSEISITVSEIIEKNPYIEEIEDDNGEVISIQEQQLIEEVVSSLLTQPLNWQQNIIKYFDELKVINPLLSKLFIWIISAIVVICLGVMTNIAYDVIKDSVIKKKPVYYENRFAAIFIITLRSQNHGMLFIN